MIAVLISGIAFTSCIYDKEDSYEDGEPMMMSLYINTLNESGTGSNYGVAERVKSLRIIMTTHAEGDSKEYIEYNEKFDLGTGLDASAIPLYRYERKVVPGVKKFYLFANEESVPSVHITPVEGTPQIPSGLTGLTSDAGISLTAYLDFFKEEISHEKDDNESVGTPYYASQLANLTPYVWLAPEYVIENGAICLPYSSYYDCTGVYKDAQKEEIIVKPWDDSQEFVRLEEPLYLIPIATKFYFTFENYRDNDVYVDNITVSSSANNNFLLGNVDSSEQKKTFRDKNYYWVNWMANVARILNGFDDDFDDSDKNREYGWISKYSMPVNTVHLPSTFFDAKTGDNNRIELKATVDDLNPDIQHIGPYYMPESYYLPEQFVGTGLLQRYNLSLDIFDDKGEGPGELAHNLTISNITTLFRSTCVEITVRMYGGGTVDIYAEMRDWNISIAYGVAQ